jgi:hypothetical protein
MTIKILEQSLKQRCTPEIIKKMCELAEGFEIENGDLNLYGSRVCAGDLIMSTMSAFPLLIHRAVEGWNRKKRDEIFKEIVIYKDKVCLDNYKLEIKQGYEDYYKYTLIDKRFSNYQPESLTHVECAMLHCLIDIFEEKEK